MKRAYVLIMLLAFFSATVSRINAQPFTYNYTGAVQTYTVPAGVSLIAVDVRGAMGGGEACFSSFQSLGGCGGRVQANIAVVPGQVLNIIIGGKPSHGGLSIGPGGYGGGGTDSSWDNTWPGAGGGGATSIADAVSGTILAIAGGGGGGGGDDCGGTGVADLGGGGGGTYGGTGYSGSCSTTGGGQGGGPVHGGNGGTCGGTAGESGTSLHGGNIPVSTGEGSGGGGGGWYGGGAGVGGSGGGGGSSYVNPTYGTSVVHTQGFNCGNGQLVIDTPCAGAGTIMGAFDICTSSSSLLTDAVTGGSWSSSNAAVATVVASGLVAAVGPGTANISYTVGTCASVVSISIDAAPVVAGITGASKLCLGDSVIFSDAAAGGVWSGSNGTIASVNAATGMVTGVDTGNVVITYTLVNSCGTDDTTMAITIDPVPFAGVITGVDTIHTGSSTMLSDTVTGGSWASTNTFVSIVSASGLVFGVMPGTDSIEYTVTNTLCSVTAYFRFTVISDSSTTSVQNGSPVGVGNMSVSPNPVKDHITIMINSQETEPVTIFLTNILGEKIKELNGITNKPIDGSIDVPTGIYLISANGEHVKLNGRFWKL